MVICLERGADLYMAQLMPLSLTVTCFIKIQIGFTFLVPAHPGSPGKRVVKRVCVCSVSYHNCYVRMRVRVPSASSGLQVNSDRRRWPDLRYYEDVHPLTRWLARRTNWIDPFIV